MKDIVKVLDIDGEKLLVVHIVSNLCLNCKRNECIRCGKPFKISNKFMLPVKKGSIIRIRSSFLIRTIQSFFALLFPIVSAVAGFFFSESISSVLFKVPSLTEIQKMKYVVIFFLVAVCLDAIHSFFGYRKRKSYAAEIID